MNLALPRIKLQWEVLSAVNKLTDVVKPKQDFIALLISESAKKHKH